MNFDLKANTIFLVLAGSRAYGTEREDSDTDYRGIHVSPRSHYLGILDNCDQVVDNKGKELWKHFIGIVEENSDIQIHEIQKFAQLASSNNPNILEILFTNEQIIKNQIVQNLIDNRHIFLSKRAKGRFIGYANDQLHKMQLHRTYLQNPMDHKPTREEFGLPQESLISLDQIGAAEAIIDKEMFGYTVDLNNIPEEIKSEFTFQLGKMMRAVWVALNKTPYPVGKNQPFAHTIDALRDLISETKYSENFLEVLRKERAYRAKKAEWDNYQSWKKNRNPARAAIEKKYGLDLKFAYHLVRLLREGKEIIETGTLTVRRPDAEELKAILNGAWTYEQIVEYAAKEEININEAIKKSTLPDKPDMKKINEMVMEIVCQFHGLK